MIDQILNQKTEIIIFSPHLDDAVFALGGLLAEIRKKSDAPITVYDFFTISNFTKHGFGDVAEISNIRKSEEKSVFLELGINCEFLDYPESVVRGHEVVKPELGYPDKIIDEIDRLAIRNITEKLREIFSRHDNAFYFFPSGNGNHVDHLCLLAAVEDLLEEHRNLRWAFYEDMPYSARASFPEKLREKYPLREWRMEIDMGTKIRLVKFYDSQPIDEWLPEIVEYIKDKKSGKAYEKIWVHER